MTPRKSVMHTRVAHGTTGCEVTITARPGPRLVVHGLSEAATRETRVRVESACLASGLTPPRATVTIDCDAPITPGACDLAIAIAALDASGQLGARTPIPLYGALGFDGGLRPVRGLYASGSQVCARGIVPASSEERRYLPGFYLEAHTLADVVRWFSGAELTPIVREVPALTPYPAPCGSLPALSRTGKGDRILLVGPPGVGKTLHARRWASELTLAEGQDAVDVCAIRSAAGLLDAPPLHVPFRAPHHSVSDAGLVGSRGRPGEVSLAHCGLLLLDEAADFRRTALDALRCALDQGRAVTPNGMVAPPWFPARPALVVGSCDPKDLKRARSLFPWTGEIEVERVTVAELLAP